MKALEKSQIIFADLSNLNEFISSVKEETQKSINANNRLGGAYSIWLDEVKEQVITAIKENKPEIQISRLHLNTDSKNFPEEPFPESKMAHGVARDNIHQLIEKLLKEKKVKKRLCNSVENDFTIKGKLSSKEKKVEAGVKEQPHKMEVIPEQPSREEKDEQQQMIPKPTPSFSSIINTKTKENPESSSFNNEFTFFKPQKENAAPISPIQPMQSISPIQPIHQIAPLQPVSPIIQIQPAEPIQPKQEESNIKKAPTVISTSKKVKIQQLPILKNLPSMISKNYDDPEYEITDNSDSSDDDEDSCSFIKQNPRWAKDKQFIEDVVIHQNKEGLYLDIFGRCKIDHLNLNMIFNTFDDKYQYRNSTADWRMDNTVKSMTNSNANGPKPISTFSTGNNPMFPKTNRQLQFSNSKN